MSKLHVTVVFFAMFLFSSISLAGFYKCSVNDKIIYSDKPCGGEQKTIKVLPEVRQDHGKKVESGGDYYSVENQLKRLEQDKEEQRKIRQEKQAIAAEHQQQEKLLKEQQNPKLDMAQCEYYQSLVKEEEHHLAQGYQSRGQRLSDESYLKMLRVKEAEYCG